MGSYLTTQTKSAMSHEITVMLPYICGRTDQELVVDPNIELVVKPSTLPSEFISGCNKGLFTKKMIVKGTVIMEMEETSMMNDGLVNLGPVLRASNSEECYQAWTDMKNSYYDMEKAKRVINVRMINDGISRYYEAIQDIPADTELLRIYGFTTWVGEFGLSATNKNIVGFAQFIDDLSKDLAGDPYEDKIKHLRELLTEYGGDNIYTIHRHEYDESMKNVELKYICGRF